MENKTVLGKTLDSIESAKVKYDMACKKILSNKQILDYIMKECLTEYKGLDTEEIEKYIEADSIELGSPVDDTEIIRGAETKNVSINEGMIRYDILFDASIPNDNEKIGLIINVEAQNNSNPGYELVTRAIYYGSRLISSQKERYFSNSNYGKIRKVYSIWVCMNPRVNVDGCGIAAYRFGESTLGNVKKKDRKVYDLINVIMLYLGENSNIKIIKMLECLFSDKKDKIDDLQNKYHLRISNNLKKEVGNMCNFSEAVYQRGIKKGEERGVWKGVVESAVKALMCNVVKDVEECKEVFGLTDEQAERVRQIYEKGNK